MKFLLSVIAVVILRHYGSLPRLHRDLWYRNWVARLGGQSWLAAIPAGRLLFSILGPVLLLWLVMGLLAGFLFNLPLIALGLLVLLYSFGRGDMDDLVTTYRDDLERADLQAAYHDAAEFNMAHRQGRAEDWQHLHREALSAIPYRYFERYFPVIFWFMVLGAPGALLYRLAELHRDLDLDDGPEKGHADNLLWILEWIPLRLLGLVFALVGDFAAAMRHWRTTLFDGLLTTSAVLEGYVYGALDLKPVPGADENSLRLSAAEVGDVVALFDRALVLWLGLAAILTLLV